MPEFEDDNEGLYPILNLGEHGIVRDMEAFELPPNAWSGGQNVRFNEKGVESASGYASQATPAVTPYGLFPVTNDLVHYWQYMSGTAARAFDGATHHDISPTAAFTGGVNDVWSGAFLNSNLVVTNGKDEPHVWNLNTGSIMTKLTGWPAGGVAQDIVAYKQFLVALNVELSGTSYPYRVKWSHQASGGGLPTSWDETDPTLDAGEADIGEDSARLIGAQQLGDVLHLFSNKRMHGMQYIGGQNVFRLFDFTGAPGLLAKRAVATFDGASGSRLAYVSDGDVMVSDGNNTVSMIDTRNRRWLFDNLSDSDYQKVQLVTDPTAKQLWLAFPEVGETTLTKALVFDYMNLSLPAGVRDLPENTYSLAGALDLSAGAPRTWADMAGTWAALAAGDTWGSGSGGGAFQDFLLMATDGDLHKVGSGNTDDGVSKTSTVERTGLVLSPDNKAARVSGVRLSGEGGLVNVTVGSQTTPRGPVTWGESKSFNPEEGYRVDARSEGRLIALRLSSTTDVSWRIRSLALEWSPGGDR